MFTGLIQEVGTILSVEENSEGKVFLIEAPSLISQIKVDDSVATNGVCLTATQIKDKAFRAQAVHVTLQKTSLGSLKPQDKVNLELSLHASDRLGGHMVQGHVNGLGKIKNIEHKGGNWEVEVSFPHELRKYMISEGSVALDGTSLTIAKLTPDSLSVSLIPHTLEKTAFHSKKVGDHLNIEVDMMAKYIENFLLQNEEVRSRWQTHFSEKKHEDE